MAGVSLEQAFAQLLADARPLGVERVEVMLALGRVAATDIMAPRSAPHFRRAAMDGYVCHDAELAGAGPDHPVRLRISGQVRMGDPPAPGPNPGEAWAITTGGAMPRRGNRVVPLEAARRSGDEIILTHLPDGKRHVAEPGEDVTSGACLVGAGQVVGAGAVGAFIACGVSEIPVYRRPRVALLATGDELVEFADGRDPPAEGRIYNTNVAVLSGELRAIGCDVQYRGIVPDRREALRAAFEGAVRDGHDVVLTTGGVSVGPYDRVPRTWLDLGAKRIVGRIDLKPGGPFFAARLGSTWAVGLSGGPAACLATYNLLVRPLLLRLAGRQCVVRPIVPVRLVDAQRGTDRLRALWARVSNDDAPRAGVLTGSAAGILGGIAQANGLVLLPAGTPPLRAGSRAATLLLDRPEDRNDLVIPPTHAAPLVVGIVGRASSGKTTIASGLLSRLRGAGLRVLAIKHAAHGFAVDRPGSDSARMFDAGAGAVMLVGPTETVLRFSTDGEVTVGAALDLAIAAAERLAGTPPQLVLVEGFHHPDRPVIQVGPPKTDEAAGEQAWAALPAVSELSPEALEAALDRLAAGLLRMVEAESAQIVRGVDVAQRQESRIGSL